MLTFFFPASGTLKGDNLTWYYGLLENFLRPSVIAYWNCLLRVIKFPFKGNSCQVTHLAIILIKLCLKFQFSNAQRIIEMVPVLKKLKVWTLYVHVVDQVNKCEASG